MITYSTNWMGPFAVSWFEDRGLEIGSAAGGRIDIRGLPHDEYYCGRYEYGLPVMEGYTWAKLTEFLDYLKTEELWSYEKLIAEFEAKHGKIKWVIDSTDNETAS